jgi:hypothetical protein
MLFASDRFVTISVTERLVRDSHRLRHKPVPAFVFRDQKMRQQLAAMCAGAIAFPQRIFPQPGSRLSAEMPAFDFETHPRCPPE